MKKTTAVFLLCLGALAWGVDEASEESSATLRMGKTDRYDALIVKHAQIRRLNPRLVKSIIAAESGFCERALSPKGARGLMQLLPLTAEEMGVARDRLDDPESNLLAGTAYLNWLFHAAWRAYGLEGVSFRDGPLWAQCQVIAAYHGGPRLLYRTDWPPLTRLYVRDVMSYYNSPATALRAGGEAVAGL